MEHKVTKNNNQVVVKIELDLRRSPSDPYVNYNTNNVVDLLKSESQWENDLICVGEAYVDNTDPNALTGEWTFKKKSKLVPKAEKKSQKPAPKKAPKKVVKKVAAPSTHKKKEG